MGEKPEDSARELLNVMGVQAAEARLTTHGATKVVSLWWSEPYVVGVLTDGRTLIVSEPELEPSEQDPASLPLSPCLPPELVSAVEAGEWDCRVCVTMDRATPATGVAYCCGLREWLPVCAEHKEELGDYGPEGCP